MFKIVVATHDETWDDEYSRPDNARNAARNYTAQSGVQHITVYYQAYRAGALTLCAWDKRTGWTKVADAPLSNCCPSRYTVADHPMCDEPDCVKADSYETHVPHTGSRMCKSGGRAHCTCDFCY